MTKKEIPYNECDGCGKPLYAGQLAVCFCRCIEQLNYTKEHPQGELTVADCHELITLCVECGDHFRVARATAILQNAVRQPRFLRN